MRTLRLIGRSLNWAGVRDTPHRCANRGDANTRVQELNPREKIPVLQDGDLTLEERGHVTYLAEKYGDRSD